MTIAKGNSFTSAELNANLGAYNCGTAYPSSAAATNVLYGLAGVGYGDRGMGQYPGAGLSAPGYTRKATDMAFIMSIMQTMNNHLGRGYTVTLSRVQGNQISGFDTPFSGTTWATAIANFDANRLSPAAGSMTLTSSAGSATRATVWGTSGTPSITSTTTITFGSEDATRYFFNSGGDIRITLSHPSVATTQDSNWNTALSSLGTLIFKANSFSRSGSGGTVTSIGYYGLTTVNQTVLSGVIGTGAYTSNTITVSVRSASITGVNGAKGSQIVITVTLTDGHSNAFYDSVAAGTAITYGYNKATTYVTGIASPSIAVGAW